MKRNELLNRIPFQPPEAALIRVIVDTDAKNEADDQFAIMHHLLSPVLDIRGIIAAHFEQKAGYTGTSMERSYQEILKVLRLAEIDDVPAYRGCMMPLGNTEDAPACDGVDFLIQEARRKDRRPLFIAVQGAMTNVAAALNKAPDIADKITVLWNGGGPYPQGRPEFNVMQDPAAARVLLSGNASVWQIPQDVYATMEVSLSEIAWKIAPCGAIGSYLMEQLTQVNSEEFNPHFLLRTGENWTLGDNTTIAVLLENRFRGHWYEAPAPLLTEKLTYQSNPKGKMIRIYTGIDVRMTLEDFFSKMNLVYGAR